MSREEGTTRSRIEFPRVTWRVSTRSSGGSGNCVEAGALLDGSQRVAVRHSHHPEGAWFVYSREAWVGFLTDVKQGAFDFAVE